MSSKTVATEVLSTVTSATQVLGFRWLFLHVKHFSQSAIAPLLWLLTVESTRSNPHLSMTYISYIFICHRNSLYVLYSFGGIYLLSIQHQECAVAHDHFSPTCTLTSLFPSGTANIYITYIIICIYFIFCFHMQSIYLWWPKSSNKYISGFLCLCSNSHWHHNLHHRDWRISCCVSGGICLKDIT